MRPAGTVPVALEVESRGVRGPTRRHAAKCPSRDRPRLSAPEDLRWVETRSGKLAAVDAHQPPCGPSTSRTPTGVRDEVSTSGDVVGAEAVAIAPNRPIARRGEVLERVPNGRSGRMSSSEQHEDPLLQMLSSMHATCDTNRWQANLPAQRHPQPPSPGAIRTPLASAVRGRVVLRSCASRSWQRR